MTTPRQRTLERMKALVAFSASALASMSCQDGCGYAVVDPLPAPGGGGFCSSFNAAFSVRVQSFSPSLDAGATSEDAATEDGIDASAGDAGADAAAEDDVDAGADATDGGTRPDGEAARPRRSTFVFIELQPGIQGVSLRRAPVEVRNAGASIVDVQSNDQLLAIEIDTTLTDELEIVISHDGRCFGMPMSPITLTIRLHEDGTVMDIRAHTPNGGEEQVPNAL